MTIQWQLKKKEIRAAIKAAAEVYMFIHPSYWEFDPEAATTLRVRVPKAYVTGLLSDCPNECVPGMERSETNQDIILFWPYQMEETESGEDAPITETESENESGLEETTV